MKNIVDRSGGIRRHGQALVAGLVLATMVGVTAGPAFAADRDRGRAVHRSISRTRDHQRGYRAYNYNNGPGYDYAPPPVVYAPYAPPALDFVFPIDIR